MKNRYRILALVIMTIILGAATFGFAGANSVPAGEAGEGSGVISGYTVTNVVYTQDSGDPTAFTTVTFTLNAAASDVYAGLEDVGGIDWDTCATTNAPTNTNFSCDLSSNTVTVAGSIALHVSSVE